MFAAAPVDPSGSPAPPLSNADGRVAGLRALLCTNAQLTLALQRRLREVESVLEAVEAARLSTVSAAATQEEPGRDCLPHIPVTAYRPAVIPAWYDARGPWRARGLVRPRVAVRRWTLGYAAPTEEKRSAQWLRVLLPPVRSAPALPRLLPTAPLLSTEAGEGEGRAAVSGKRLREGGEGGEGARLAAHASRSAQSGGSVSPRERSPLNVHRGGAVRKIDIVRAAYKGLPALAGISFSESSGGVVKVAGERAIGLSELHRLLCETLSVPRERNFAAYSPNIHRMYGVALTHLAELGMARASDVRRTKVLRRLLRLPYIKFTYSLLERSFAFAGAAACTDSDVVHTERVAIMKVFQRRRRAHEDGLEGSASSLADKVAVAIARAASLEGAFREFDSPLQALAFALVGLVVDDPSLVRGPIRPMDVGLLLDEDTSVSL